ncbi:MAG: nascent polypeptide-associated complex protein [archaeon]
MIPKMNPRQMEKMMKQMGIKSENIEAEEVVIRCADKEMIITNPSIQKVNMMGQVSFQISGELSEREINEDAPKYTDDDIQMVMDQTNCEKNEAIDALKETDGDIAEAILILTKG